ncbi:horcolin-like [Miscanthus floridulus]|uniref:horcolin-like n=1 Tax=Miscanthus floridulus TaxID=154761 RepID=UPI00345A4797
MSIKLDKIGPRGGPGGGVRDVQVPPYRLLRLAIHSKGAINGISFSYTGSDGSVHHESWGGVSGFEEHPIQLGLTDYVKEISGTIGAYTRDHPNIVRSLKVVTFKRTYGPYGATDGAGRPFSFPVQGSARITGFFGRSGDYLDSIGVYIREC